MVCRNDAPVKISQIFGKYTLLEEATSPNFMQTFQILDLCANRKLHHHLCIHKRDPAAPF